MHLNKLVVVIDFTSARWARLLSKSFCDECIWCTNVVPPAESYCLWLCKCVRLLSNTKLITPNRLLNSFKYPWMVCILEILHIVRMLCSEQNNAKQMHSVIRVALHLLHNPRYVLGHVSIDAGQLWVGALDAPRNDAADEPSVAILRILAQQRTAGVALFLREICD